MRLEIPLPWSFVSYVAVCGIVLYGLYYAAQPRTIALVIDPQCSSLVHEQCRSLLTPQFVQQHSSRELFAELKKTVRSAQQCSLRHTGLQKAVIRIQGQKPFIRINNNFVLSASGVLLPAAELRPEILERLPAISVQAITAEQKEIIKDIFSCMQALPSDLIENHAIVWVHKTAIYFLDQATPDITVVATHTTTFTPELLKNITLLKAKTLEALKKKGQKAQKKIIDVRIPGQIVVRNMQGGEYENTTGEKYYNGN